MSHLKLIWLIPLAKTRIESTLSNEQLIQRIRGAVRFRSSLLLGLITGSAGQLVGKWNDGNFILARAISYQNAYLPYVRGRIQSTGQGSVLELTFYAPYSSFVLLGIGLMSYFALTRGLPGSAGI